VDLRQGLRAFLRADPDVIMVGEIRDAETAQTAIEASLTGHLVLSTLHTNSAPETVTRLLDMGMDPFNFGDSLLAVLAQRLVRRLCPHCRSAREASADEVDELLQDHIHVFPTDLRQRREDVLADWQARFGEHGALLHYTAPAARTARAPGAAAALHCMNCSSSRANCAADPDRQPRRGTAARGPDRWHAHLASGRDREGLVRGDDHCRGAGDEQRLTFAFLVASSRSRVGAGGAPAGQSLSFCWPRKKVTKERGRTPFLGLAARRVV
jgi:hypothetical protein